MKGKYLLIAALLSFISFSVNAQVLVSFDTANPPFMYEVNNAPAGLYPVLIKEAFKRMGVAITERVLPWKRALRDCDAGKSGIGGIYKNTERAAKWDYSAPFFEERLAIYVPGTKKIKYEKIQDLYGKTIGVIRGWSYGDAFDAAVRAGKINKEETDGDEINFKKLARGRVDAVISIWESGEVSIANLKLQSTVTRLPNLLSTKSVYLVFNKSAQMTETLARFDAAIVSMKNDGSFNVIMKSVFGK